MSDETDSGESDRSGPGPYADVLREYPPEERRRRRRQYKRAHEDITERKEMRRKARVRRRALRYPFVKAGVGLVGCLPVGVAAWLGERIGALIFRFAKSARHRVLFQLRLAFPERSDEELHRIARDMFQTMCRGAVSLPSIRRKGVDWVLEHFEVDGEEHLRGALEEGKGVILVAYHYGPFEVATAWLSKTFGTVAVGRDAGTLDATQVLIDIREELGLTTIQRGDARAIVRALRENRPVGFVADHDVSNVNGVFVPFFGHLAHTPLGPAALAHRMGVPMVPILNVWKGRTRYLLRIFPVMRPRDDLPKDEAIRELTYRFTKLGEEAIRERPEHWLWLHKRWETRPEARPDLPVWRPAEGPDADPAA